MTAHPAEAFAGLDPDLLATDPDVVAGYATDEATLTGTGAPKSVLLPRTTDDVATMLAIAHTLRIPLVTRGAGSWWRRPQRRSAAT